MNHEGFAKIVNDGTRAGLDLWLALLQVLVMAKRKTDRKSVEKLLRRMARRVTRRPTLDDCVAHDAVHGDAMFAEYERVSGELDRCS